MVSYWTQGLCLLSTSALPALGTVPGTRANTESRREVQKWSDCSNWRTRKKEAQRMTPGRGGTWVYESLQGYCNWSLSKLDSKCKHPYSLKLEHNESIAIHQMCIEYKTGHYVLYRKTLKTLPGLWWSFCSLLPWPTLPVEIILTWATYSPWDGPQVRFLESKLWDGD